MSVLAKRENERKLTKILGIGCEEYLKMFLERGERIVFGQQLWIIID